MIAYLNFHTAAAGLNALVLGGLFLSTFIVAPLLFSRLERDQAGTLAGAMFARTLPLFGLCSLIAAMLLFYRYEALLLAGNGVVFLLLGTLFVPYLEYLRAQRGTGGPDAVRRFRLAHGFSQVLNLAQLAVAAFVFFRLAA